MWPFTCAVEECHRLIEQPAEEGGLEVAHPLARQARHVPHVEQREQLEETRRQRKRTQLKGVVAGTGTCSLRVLKNQGHTHTRNQRHLILHAYRFCAVDEPQRLQCPDQLSAPLVVRDVGRQEQHCITTTDTQGQAEVREPTLVFSLMNTTKQSQSYRKKCVCVSRGCGHAPSTTFP